MLLEERCVVPFCGEIWDSHFINDYTSWVDFPLVEEALVYARTFARVCAQQRAAILAELGKADESERDRVEG